MFADSINGVNIKEPLNPVVGQVPSASADGKSIIWVVATPAGVPSVKEMSFSWKRFTMFGFEILLPFAKWIVKNYATEEQVIAFRRHKVELAECNKCHKLFGVRAGMSFIMHLMDVHHLDENETIAIVSSLYQELLTRKAVKKLIAKEISNG